MSLALCLIKQLLSWFHHFRANEDDRDIVDSDFSDDENDEPVTDDDDNERTSRRRKKVVTRSYKEPTKPSASAAAKKATTSPKKKPIKPSTSKLKSPEKRAHLRLDSKKSLRKSTAVKSAETQHRLKVRTEAERLKPKVAKVEYAILTQEELLAECKQTEKENIQSLEKFRRMELEKKRVRPSKGSVYTGPIIRYQSLSMPVIEDGKLVKEIAPIEMDSDDKRSRTTRRSRMAATDAAKAAEKNRCERTFISVVNDLSNAVFEQLFPTTKAASKLKSQRMCPISMLDAKYIDPVTQMPYYGPHEFKILREGYYRMLETQGPSEDSEVAQWLAWRKRSNEQKLKKAKLDAANWNVTL